MNRTLIAGLVCAAACVGGVAQARGLELQGDVLAALLMTDTANAQIHATRRAGDPAPATYADRALPFGGGGGHDASEAPAASTDAPAVGDTGEEPRSPPAEPVPAQRMSPWRALLPGSIQ